MTVFVAVTLKDQRQETLARFEDAVRRSPAIEKARLMSGESDDLMKIPVPADDSCERIHRDVLGDFPGVRRLVSQFSIRAVVETA